MRKPNSKTGKAAPKGLFALLLAAAFTFNAIPAAASFFGGAGSQPVGNVPPATLPGNPAPAGSFFGGGSAPGAGGFFKPPAQIPVQPQPSATQPSGSFFGGGYTPPQTIPPFGQVPQNLKIIAYGDSIVRGVGATQGNDFVSLLAARTGAPITNAGASGATSASALQALDGILSQSPSIVIVFIGGNDILARLPAATIYSNVREIVSRIKAAGSDVVLMGIHDPIFGIDYETGYRQIAVETGSYFVPGVLEDIIGRPFLMADAIHPNNIGHRMIADRVEPVLRTAIQGRIGGSQTGGQVSCAASPTNPTVGQTVIWTASVTGASGPTAFSWTGDENLLGNGQTVAKRYSSPGTKAATVYFASGSAAASATCAVTVADPPPAACVPIFRIGSFVLCSR